MKAVAVVLFGLLLICGCTKEDSTNDIGPGTAPPAAGPTAKQQQDATEAEQALRTLGAPIYSGATVVASEHSFHDEEGANAVFETSDSVQQVEAYYGSLSELKQQTANGINAFAGTMNGSSIVAEVRKESGKTHIILQARKFVTIN